MGQFIFHKVTAPFISLNFEFVQKWYHPFHIFILQFNFAGYATCMLLNICGVIIVLAESTSDEDSLAVTIWCTLFISMVTELASWQRSPKNLSFFNFTFDISLKIYFHLNIIDWFMLFLFYSLHNVFLLFIGAHLSKKVILNVVRSKV